MNEMEGKGKVDEERRGCSGKAKVAGVKVYGKEIKSETSYWRRPRRRVCSSFKYHLFPISFLFNPHSLHFIFLVI